MFVTSNLKKKWCSGSVLLEVLAVYMQPYTYIPNQLHVAATQQKLYKDVKHLKLSFNGCYQ
jgi:hypothetical protein